MKKIATLAMTAVLSIAAAALTVSSASAGQRHHRPHYDGPTAYNSIYYGTPVPAERRPLFSASVTILGLSFGRQIHGPYWAPEPYGYAPAVFPRAYARSVGSDAQVAWCFNRYRSYDPATNTYLGYDGARHYCVPR